jgi:hypothetical protein
MIQLKIWNDYKKTKIWWGNKQKENIELHYFF